MFQHSSAAEWGQWYFFSLYVPLVTRRIVDSYYAQQKIARSELCLILEGESLNVGKSEKKAGTAVNET